MLWIVSIGSHQNCLEAIFLIDSPMIISDAFSKLKLLEQSGAVSQAIRRSSFPSWLVNSPRASLIRLLSPLTPSTDLLAPPLCRAKRCRCANAVLIAGPSQERKRERERTSSRTFVCTFSRHFSVNEPHVAGEPSWSTRAARPPLRRVHRFNPPLQSRRPRQVGRSTILSLPDADPPRHRGSPPASPDSSPSPLLSTPRRRDYNPFHLQDSLPTRSLNSSRSPPPLFFISFTLLGVPFARLLPHRHLQPPPCFPAAYLSLSFSPLPSPSRVVQCRNTYDGTSVLLTSQVSALG